MLARDADWWEDAHAPHPPERGAGGERRRGELDGRAAGYALYRIAPEFEGTVPPAPRLEVNEAIGATPQATAEIWRFLLDIDWTAGIEAWLLPPDHPLFLLLAEPRRLATAPATRSWVRLVDVGAALLGARVRGGEVVLDVRDEFPVERGTWLLEGRPRERTGRGRPALEVADLGSAYLGGFSFASCGTPSVEELTARARSPAPDALFRGAPARGAPRSSEARRYTPMIREMLLRPCGTGNGCA